MSQKKKHAKHNGKDGQQHGRKHVEESDITAQPGAETEPAEGPVPEAVAAATDLQAELERALAVVAENEDKYLRAKADMENLRRRTGIEMVNAKKYAIEKFAAEVLAVKDSLELARAVDFEQGNEAAVEKMFEGLDLTLKLMNNVFEKFSLQEVNPEKGEKFDPQKHQAMSTMESEDVAPNHVVSVVQKGYLLNDRLLRPAMVIVAKTKSEQNQAGLS